MLEIGAGFELFAEGNPVQAGQEDVGHHQVGLFPGDQFQAADAVGGDKNRVARVAERFLQRFLNNMIVINDRNSLALLAPVAKEIVTPL